MEINFYDIMETDNNNDTISENAYLYIKKVYNYLRVLGCVTSAGQFSEIYLHKSRDYYARLKCNQLLPSMNAVNNLLGVLEDKCSEYASRPDKKTHYNHISHLLKEGYFLQMKRVESL